MDQNLLPNNIKLENLSIEAENIVIEAAKPKIYYSPYFLNVDELEGFNNENLYLLEDIKSENYEYAEETRELELNDELIELVDEIVKPEVKAEVINPEVKLEIINPEVKAEIVNSNSEFSSVVNLELDDQEEPQLLRKLAEEEEKLKKLAEEEEKLKKKIKENKIFCILFFFVLLIHKLENPLIKYTEELSIIITTKKERNFDLLISEDYLAFELVDLKKYFTNLNNFLNQAERAQTKYEFIYKLNQIPIIKYENKILYPAGFNKIKNNFIIKGRENCQDWILSDSLRQTTKYFSEYKPSLAKSKINALLKDKLLVKNIFNCITLTNYKAINRRTLKKIRRYIKKKRFLT